MLNKDLKELSRAELLEMLVALSEEKEGLEAELEQARRAARERALVVKEAGSIADAALKLNDVFEQAQAAADQYLESIALLKQRLEQERPQSVKEAEEEAKRILAQAKEKADGMIRVAIADCEAMREMTQREMDWYI